MQENYNNMKKLFLTVCFISVCNLGFTQDVKVNINNEEESVKDDCPYRINGICATEDIGGVEVMVEPDYLILTNYNDFPVTVLWKVEYMDDCNGSGTKSGNTVLGVSGEKKVYTGIGRYCTSLTGLIVRKLATQTTTTN